MNNNISITFKPIDKTDYENISHKCWDDDKKVEQLFSLQDALGIGAWVGDKSVGSLHFYQLDLKEPNLLFPGYGIVEPHHFPLGLPTRALLDGLIKCEGKVLGISCYHVGLIKNDQDDSIYYKKGIGTQLCLEAINWAKQNGYLCVIAHGCPKNLYEYNIGFGGLPWTTYKKLGFHPIFDIKDTLSQWLKDLPKGYKDRIEEILNLGGTNEDITNSIMVLDL